MENSKKILVILGPTASGKSLLAEKAADAFGGVIINADSMQIYKNFPVLSAMPSISSSKRYALYGILDMLKDEQSSAANWSCRAKEKIRSAWRNEQLPILVGGTGFYIKALLEGLSPIPNVPLDFRITLEERFKNPILRSELYQYFKKNDPEGAALIEENDTQRLIRALEVLLHSRKPLSFWQKQPKQPFIEGRFHIVTILPDRDLLYQRINKRVEEMLKNGAIEEVQAMIDRKKFDAKGLIGFQEIYWFLTKSFSYAETIGAIQQKTRNYAKRQITWLRHQIESDLIINTLL